MILEIHKCDWDKAVSLITEGAKDFSWGYVDLDKLCNHCVLATAAKRQFGKENAYYFGEEDELLYVGDLTFQGSGLRLMALRFDHHLMHGRLAPSTWPVRIKISLAMEVSA